MAVRGSTGMVPQRGQRRTGEAFCFAEYRKTICMMEEFSGLRGDRDTRWRRADVIMRVAALAESKRATRCARKKNPRRAPTATERQPVTHRELCCTRSSLSLHSSSARGQVVDYSTTYSSLCTHPCGRRDPFAAAQPLAGDMFPATDSEEIVGANNRLTCPTLLYGWRRLSERGGGKGK